MPFDLYDPTLITLPKEHNCFRDDERPFVEPNLYAQRAELPFDGERCFRFRLRLSVIDDSSRSDVDTYLTPITPICQPGTFGAIEPAMAHVTGDFTIPSSDYKWNQIVELQLPDGKKVRLPSVTRSRTLRRRCR